MFLLGRKYVFKIIYPSIILFLFIFPIRSVKAQQISDNQVKAGFIYSFLKYVTWEKEDRIDTFKIAVYGDDPELILALKGMEKMLVKNKPIIVESFQSIGEINYSQILFITNNRNYFIKDIFELLKSSNTLLVTDRYEFQRYVMINFIYNENSKIQFEINTNNVQEARLKTSPKLILIGGSEIDLRKLYIETEKSLVTEKEKAESYEKELAQKKEEIQIMNSKLYGLYKEIQNNRKKIDTLNNKISNQKSELNTLQIQTKELQINLRVKNNILNKQTFEIAQKEKLLNSQKSEIFKKQLQVEEYSKYLSQQKSEINKRQSIIENQGKTLIRQIEKIKIQKSFLYLFITLTLVTITLVFFIYYNYNIKRKKNLELERMNIEINNKKNEIFLQAEQLELKNTELEKLSIVARETDNAIVITNGQGDFEWINEGFTRFYGYTLDEFIKTKGTNLVNISTYDNIKEIMSFLADEKRSVSYESPSINRIGKKIWINTTITPILDENKNIKKLIIIDSDITQLKEAELDIINKNEEIQRQSEALFEHAERLLDLNIQLETKKNNLEEALEKLKSAQIQLVESEKMIILGQLTAGIAHEINNPINFINSGIEGLKIAFHQLLNLFKQYEQITPDNVSQMLKKIVTYKRKMNYPLLLSDINELTKDVKTGIFRTVEIIKGLRTFSRLDESDLKYIDIHNNIDSTLVILRNKYINRIEIIKDYGNINEIECYPGKINQVFLNILVNAVQAIKDTGKIYISTKQINKDGLQNLVISIRDTGMGIDEETKKRIFEPFYTTKDAGEGTGLGLSISQSIIENHQGTIEVKSKCGEGTEFIIYLPVAFQKKEKTLSKIE